MAREIQQGYLPTDFAPLGEAGFELFARVHPARQVSGDLYDFFPLPDGRLAFFVGDVSGKGMPAALFMVAVRTLARHLAPSAAGPADAPGPPQRRPGRRQPVGDVRDPGLRRSTTRAPARWCWPRAATPGRCCAGPTGAWTRCRVRNGRLLGYAPGGVGLSDTMLTLAPGETLVIYTDGFTEAHAPDGVTMFGAGRLAEALGGERTALPLERLRRGGEGGGGAVHREGGNAGRPDVAPAAAAVNRFGDMRGGVTMRTKRTTSKAAPFTFDDFCALVREDQKADLINGVIYMASPENTDANEIFVWLIGLVYDFADYYDLGKVYGSRVAFHLDDNSSPEPDIAFLSKRNLRRVKRRWVEGGPDLAVEIVSPESIDRDYNLKRKKYEEAGVPEYWIIDEIEETVTLLQPGGRRQVPRSQTEKRRVPQHGPQRLLAAHRSGFSTTPVPRRLDATSDDPRPPEMSRSLPRGTP